MPKSSTQSNGGSVRLELLGFVGCLLIWVGAACLGSYTQRDFGKVNVKNVFFKNEHDYRIRGKLFVPNDADAQSPMPGVIFIHGYQSTRETGDSFSIELARRGFVVLGVDALGRGNSDNPPLDETHPEFDETFGGLAAYDYLRHQPMVQEDAIGFIGHSLGAEMAYKVTQTGADIKALVIVGSAYSQEVTPTFPKNMLMIIGQYDEFRDRMTGTDNIREQWLTTSRGKAPFTVESPVLNTTYGNFSAGTARRVVIPGTIHILETHNSLVVTEILHWMKDSLQPSPSRWIPVENQRWQLKEWCTLLAMIAGIASLLPLGMLIYRISWFSKGFTHKPATYTCPPNQFYKFSIINGLLMWLYLPSVLILFAIHKYVTRIDSLFPMIVVDCTAFWFLMINVIGFIFFKKWVRKSSDPNLLYNLGISYQPNTLHVNWSHMGKQGIMVLLLFGFLVGIECLLESLYLVDFRFVFAFANDLTGYRVKMFLLYLPFFILGFLQLGFFLHGQLYMTRKTTPIKSFAQNALQNTAVLVIPLMVMLMIQYIPLFTTGAIPFVGPGGALVLFTFNIFHIIGVLMLIIPLQTGFHQLTGRPYTGALLNAAIVTWMFVSSQVITPVPIK